MSDILIYASAIHKISKWRTNNVNGQKFRDRSMWFECQCCGKIIKNYYSRCPKCDVPIKFDDSLVGVEFQNYDEENKTWVPDKYWSFLYTLEEYDGKDGSR